MYLIISRFHLPYSIFFYKKHNKPKKLLLSKYLIVFTYQPHLLRPKAHKNNIYRPTNCDSVNFPINSRSSVSSFVSFLYRSTRPRPSPSSVRGFYRPPSFSITSGACKIGLPENNEIRTFKACLEW